MGGNAQAHPPTCLLSHKGEDVGNDVPQAPPSLTLAPIPIEGQGWGRGAT